MFEGGGGVLRGAFGLRGVWRLGGWAWLGRVRGGTL